MLPCRERAFRFEHAPLNKSVTRPSYKASCFRVGTRAFRLGHAPFVSGTRLSSRARTRPSSSGTYAPFVSDTHAPLVSGTRLSFRTHTRL